jgi:hypothetical protein
MTAAKTRLDVRKALEEMDPGEAPCAQAQADGVPCMELGMDCEDCPQGFDGLFNWIQEHYGIRIKRLGL